MDSEDICRSGYGTDIKALLTVEGEMVFVELWLSPTGVQQLQGDLEGLLRGEAEALIISFGTLMVKFRMQPDVSESEEDQDGEKP